MDSGRRARRGDLRALTYHRDVADRLGANAHFSEADPEVGPSADRLDLDARPLVRNALARAVENLGLERPVAVYQGSEAGLFSQGDELVVVLPSIPPLTEVGLSAVLGRALAPHLFRSLDGGRYRAAEGLLALDPSPPAVQTLRRFRLASELFGDRVGAVACGDRESAISALGLVDVRAEALREWVTDPSTPSVGEALLRPGLDLATLDLFDRDELERVTRALIEDYLLFSDPRPAATSAQAQQYFPDLTPSPGSVPPLSVRPVPVDVSNETRVYLGFVLLDLITAGPDADLESAVAGTLRFAEEVGLGPELNRSARAELLLSAAAWNRIEGVPAR